MGWDRHQIRPGRDIRVVLADSARIYRRHLREFLDRQPELRVVGEVDSGADAAAMVERLRPDALIIDVTTHIVDGLALVRQISAANRGLQIVALSLYENRQFREAAFASGASEFVTKDDAADALPGILREKALR